MQFVLSQVHKKQGLVALIVATGAGLYFAAPYVVGMRAQARAVLMQGVGQGESIEFGRFSDAGSGGACQEFTITDQGGRVKRSETARIGREHGDSCTLTVWVTYRNFDECYVRSAG